jgi:Na+/melibiose symporter-like transporter
VTAAAEGFTLGFATVVPCGLSLAFFSRYRLDRERHAEIRVALAARAEA